MGLFDKAIKDAIGKAVGNAVQQGVRQAVQPKVNEAASKAASAAANAAAQKLNDASSALGSSISEAKTAIDQANQEASKVTSEQWGQAFSVLEGMANSAAKNMKVCASCGQPAAADQKFCPSCGAKLPEMTLADGALCPQCGHQNTVGTSFCTACGAKLPMKEAQEQAQKETDEAELAKWDSLLASYPKWCFGGDHFELEDRGTPEQLVTFSAANTSQAELDRYVALLKENGFVRPGGYSSDDVLYKVVNGVCRCFGQTDAFSGGEDCFFVSFYVDNSYLQKKEEPPKKSSGLFGGLFG